jgi:hypothetical protein
MNRLHRNARHLVVAGAIVALAIALTGCELLQQFGFLSPSTPGGLETLTNNETSIIATWDGVSGADNYQLFRSTSITGPWIDPVYVGSDTTYTDTGLEGGTTYYYAVAASNRAGASAVSAPVSGTTKPSSEATLSGMTIEDEYGVNIPLTPSYTPLQNNYDAGVVGTITSDVCFLTLTTTNAHATITSVTEYGSYTGTVTDSLVSGMDGVYALQLLDYNNLITITVTAQDGTSTETYTITIQNYNNG